MLRPASLVLAIAMLLPGCNRKPAVRYDDDVDIAAAKRVFGCALAPSDPASADACRILDDFAGAGTFAAWPAANGMDMWYGHLHCSALTEDAGNVSWAAIVFHDGAEPTTMPSENATIDASRAIPVGIFSMFSRSSMKDDDGRAAQRHLFEAAEHGTHPDFTDVPSLRSFFEGIWSDLRHPAPGSYVSLSKSTGTSVLENAFTTSVPGSSAAKYLRAKGNRLLIVEPARPGHSTPPAETCVAEVWKTVP